MAGGFLGEVFGRFWGKTFVRDFGFVTNCRRVLLEALWKAFGILLWKVFLWETFALRFAKDFCGRLLQRVFLEVLQEKFFVTDFCGRFSLEVFWKVFKKGLIVR